MSSKQWPDPFPKTPDGFHQTLTGALTQLEANDMKRKYKLTTSLAAALILVVALGAVALAAVKSGVLDYLFEDRQPPQLAEENLVETQQSMTSEGVTMAFDGYINDGSELMLVWTISSERDELVLVRTETPILSEMLESRSMSGLIGDGQMLALGGEVQGYAFDKSVQVSIPYDVPPDMEGEKLDLTLRASAYHPAVPLKIRGDEGGDTPDMFGGSGELLLDKLGYTLPMSEVPMSAVAKLTDLTLDATVVPPKSALHTMIDGQNVFEFDEYLLTVKQLDIGATRARCTVEMVTKGPYPDVTENWFYDPLAGRNFRLKMDKGETLDMMRCDPVFEHLPDGRMRAVFVFETDPPQAVPETVTIIPVFMSSEQADALDSEADDFDQLEQFSLMDEAVTVKLRQGELPEQRHTTIDGEAHFAFDEYAFDIIKLDFSDERTVLGYRMVTKVPVDPDDWNAPLLNRSYALFDGEGNQLAGIDDIEGDRRYRTELQPDGTLWIQGQLTWPGVPEVPERAMLAPVAYPFADGAYGDDLSVYTLDQMNDIYRNHIIQDEVMVVGVQMQ